MTGLDENSRYFLERSLRNGSAILFTGAGFSSLAVNASGENLPGGSELRDALWRVAFPDEPLDATSTLGEVFDAALRLSRHNTELLLRERLTVDAPKLPRLYEEFFSLPWYRIYTLNIDDLIAAAERRFNLPYDFRIISGLKESVPPPDILSAVHLNGLLSDFPNITFSPPQYGDRAARPDDAYGTLLRDLRSHCVIFIGTQLDEPPLWQHLALRGDPPSGRELRPKSFLVTRSISRARAVMLDRLNIRHVPMTVEEFYKQFIIPAAADRPTRPSIGMKNPDPFERLDLALSDPVIDAADFLLGREPTWGDVTQGFAIERTFESTLLNAAKNQSNRVVTLSATSGAGKSTTLRRLALTLHSSGKSVGWLRLDASQSVQQIKVSALSSRLEYVVIDRAERFGQRGVELIRALAEADEGPHVIVSYGAIPYDELDVERSLYGINTHSEIIPLLDDHDIRALIDALTRGNRLGRLAGLSIDKQVNAFEKRANRQLLVAMIEATSGQRFEDKIANECRALSPDLEPAYTIISLATSLHYAIRVDDLLAALSDVTPSGLELLDRLLRQHLVVRTADGGILARHAVIAREAITYYRRSGQLAVAIDRFAFVLASKIYPQMPRATPERRLLNTLVNHDYLGREIDSVPQVREIYGDLESLLRYDAHFWLQRGSYELERGDIKLAENFLAQARGLADDDYMIETEWAYLLMKRATMAPNDSRARDWMDEALTSLYDIITHRGAQSFKTYVVLAEQVIQWASAASLSVDEKKSLFLGVRSVMADGRRYHQMNRQFATAQRDIERAYLDLATRTSGDNFVTEE
jgi:hypothetical protein